MRNLIVRSKHRVGRLAGSVLLKRRFERGDRRFLFILGHQRSGSSLLVHLLCSNPAIVGYGEQHFRYYAPADLYTSALRIHLHADPHVWRDRTRYVLDKVLHRAYIRDVDVLQHDAARIIFILREPLRALTSMINGKPEPERALQHYEDQLAWIGSLSTSLPSERWTAVTYQDLTQQAEATLHRLTHFLDLAEPLTPRYALMSQTGAWGAGDVGPLIRTGRILENKDQPLHPDVPPLLPRAEAAWSACRARLEAAKAPAASK